jgi:hypothetical protein
MTGERGLWRRARHRTAWRMEPSSPAPCTYVGCRDELTPASSIPVPAGISKSGALPDWCQVSACMIFATTVSSEGGNERRKIHRVHLGIGTWKAARRQAFIEPRVIPVSELPAQTA